MKRRSKNLGNPMFRSTCMSCGADLRMNDCAFCGQRERLESDEESLLFTQKFKEDTVVTNVLV
jgi:hypothetical protein